MLTVFNSSSEYVLKTFPEFITLTSLATPGASITLAAYPLIGVAANPTPKKAPSYHQLKSVSHNLSLSKLLNYPSITTLTKKFGLENIPPEFIKNEILVIVL